MDQSQIEKVILSRIQELRRLEAIEHQRAMKVSYQDKRDELEVLLLRIRWSGDIQATAQEPSVG